MSPVGAPNSAPFYQPVIDVAKRIGHSLQERAALHPVRPAAPEMHVEGELQSGARLAGETALTGEALLAEMAAGPFVLAAAHFSRSNYVVPRDYSIVKNFSESPAMKFAAKVQAWMQAEKGPAAIADGRQAHADPASAKTQAALRGARPGEDVPANSPPNEPRWPSPAGPVREPYPPEQRRDGEVRNAVSVMSMDSDRNVEEGDQGNEGDERQYNPGHPSNDVARFDSDSDYEVEEGDDDDDYDPNDLPERTPYGPDRTPTDPLPYYQ